MCDIFALQAASKIETKIEEDYNAATLLFNEEEYELAQSDYKSILSYGLKNETVGKAAFYLAECLFAQKLYKESRESFRSFLKSYTEHPLRSEGQYRISECFFFLEDYALASKAYLRYVEENPKHKFVARALYAAAGSLLESGQYADALKIYDRLINEFPGHELLDRAHYYKGWAYLRGKNYNEASEAFLEFEAKYPSSSFKHEALLRAADAQFSGEKFSTSLNLYNRVLAKSQGAFQKEARVGIAWSYYKMKSFEKAANMFVVLARAEGKGEAKADYFYQSIRSYFDGEKYSIGLAVCEESSKKCAGSRLLGDIYYWHGMFLSKLSRFEEAALSFKKSAESKPVKVKQGDVGLELGNVYLKMGQKDKAIAAFRNTLSLASQEGSVEAQLRYDCARALHQLGKTQEAIAMVSPVTGSKSEDNKLKFLSEFSLGEYKFASEQFSAAVKHYETVLGSKADDTLKLDARYRLGWSYKSLGLPKKALAVFSQMKIEGAKNKYAREVRFLIAGLNMDLGQDDLGKNSYYELIKSKGEYSGESYLALAEIAFEVNDFPRAERLLEEYLQVLPGHSLEADGHFLLAEVLFEQNKLSDALAHYTVVANDNASQLRENALYGRAWLYYDMNDHVKALADLDMLLKKYPKSQFEYSSIQLKGKIYVAMNQ
ncbi:MAG: tetratricopeptide repeat protein, partial [Planctomycetes bacterium]|nr:tetratricopeptide repeat protein [Planctomycetota bacterium]